MQLIKYANLQDYIKDFFNKYSHKTMMVVQRRWRTEKFTYQQIYGFINKLGIYFKQQHLKPQDKILLIGPNSPEFLTLLLGAYYHNIVVVPVDLRSSPKLLKKYIQLTKPKIIFSTKIRQRDLINIPGITKKVVVLEDLLSILLTIKILTIAVSDHVNVRKIIPQDLAEIMFTSDTIENSKGVMLTQQNLVTNIFDSQKILPKLKAYHSLSVLPLSHIFEQIATFVLLFRGTTIYFPEKINALTIKNSLNSWAITHLVLVPQILKNLYQSILQGVEDQGKTDVFYKMQKVAPYLPWLVRRLLFRSVHKKLGGHIKFIVTGGDKLDIEVAKKWQNMGFSVIEGYGAAETAAVVSSNFLENSKLGSVGLATPVSEIKIDDNQEVFTSDGWYRTPTKKINHKLVQQALLKPNTTVSVLQDTPDLLINLLREVTALVSKKIDDQTNLGSDLGLDSIGRVELISLVEDSFDVVIDDYKVNARTTLQDLKQMIKENKVAPSPTSIEAKYFTFLAVFLRVIFVKLILYPVHSLFFKTQIEGLAKIKDLPRPLIFMHNHIGVLDSLCFTKYLKGRQNWRIVAAASGNFWSDSTKWLRRFLKVLGAFPISPNQEAGARTSLQRIGKMLDLGFSVIVAPEGKISRDGKLQDLRRGTGIIASKMGAIVVPIRLEGDYRKVFPLSKKDTHQRKFTELLPRFVSTRVRVVVGDPLDLRGQSYEKATVAIQQSLS